MLLILIDGTLISCSELGHLLVPVFLTEGDQLESNLAVTQSILYINLSPIYSYIIIYLPRQ